VLHYIARMAGHHHHAHEEHSGPDLVGAARAALT
jgi:hypothetical protein